MPNINLSRLENEWVTLQNQYDSYEKCSLAIKLTSVITCCLLLFAMHLGLWTAPILAILWLQDGIWKTFQNRIGQRLEKIEQAIQVNQQNNHPEVGMQFNIAWSQSRPNAKGLIVEYVAQSLKPTVAYPYFVLLVLILTHTYVIQ